MQEYPRNAPARSYHNFLTETVVAWHTPRSRKKQHLQAYLEEYTFRFNRRKAAQRGLLFYRLLENAVKVAPTTYDQLIGKG
jgi:hypothetical protein